MGNIEKKILSLLRTFWWMFGGGFFVVIFVGLLVYMLKDFSNPNPSFFYNLAILSLTLFGITFLSRTFDTKSKFLNLINTMFFGSFLGFMYLNSYIVLDLQSVENFAKKLLSGFLYISMIASFFGLLVGLFILGLFLFERWEKSI